MKKTFLISALISSVLAVPVFAATNLWEYFHERGEKLPSISARSNLYEAAGLGEGYKGTAEQNRSLLSFLQDDIRLGFLAPPSSTVEGTSTAGWTDDGSNVRLNTASDFVGIGTAAPADKLSVVGGNASVSGDISLSGGDLNIGAANSTTTLTRTTAGLGFGTTTPVTTFGMQGSLFVSGTTTSGVLQATSTLIASTTRFSGGPQYSWPTSEGSNLQALTTNGAGTLSWQSVVGSGATSSLTNMEASGNASSTRLWASLTANLPIYATSTSVTGGAGADVKTTATVYCLSGDRAISGYVEGNDLGGSWQLTSQGPTTYQTSGDAWTATADNIDAITLTLTIGAMCLNGN